jgi:tRNA1(Val) A37 N6-methylase TrmN6
MTGHTRLTGALTIARSTCKFGNSSIFSIIPLEFPWDQLKPGTTLCDLGSGVGSVTLAIAKAHPHLQVTLHDLEAPLKEARAVGSLGYVSSLLQI